jgi:DDE_Tnp_1-associated
MMSAQILHNASTTVCQIAIIEAFIGLKDPRRRAGQRHTLPLCLALFTLAIAAGNRGFLAIGDWISSYHEQLVDLLKPPKNIAQRARLIAHHTDRIIIICIQFYLSSST